MIFRLCSLTFGPYALIKWKTGPQAPTDLANFCISSSCTSIWVLTLIQGFLESYLSCLRISWGLICLTTVSLLLTALSGQFTDQIARLVSKSIIVISEQRTFLFMAKALATGVLWCLFVKVSRNYHWLAFSVRLSTTIFRAMWTPNHCQESCTNLFLLGRQSFKDLQRPFSGVPSLTRILPQISVSWHDDSLLSWVQLCLLECWTGCFWMGSVVSYWRLMSWQRVQKQGELRKHPWKLIRLAQLASPVASVVVWDWETS